MFEISVIMSVYNGSDFLDKSINSILDQTFHNFEFIIIDDGSEDNSIDIVNKYLQKDKRIILFKNQENKGLPFSLNVGINSSKGKYIARQDADDISLPERLSIQYKYMESNKEIHLLGSNNKVIDIYDNILYDDNHFSKIRDYYSFLLSGRAIFVHGSAFIRAGTVIRLNGYNENFYYSQDCELWLRFLLSGYKIKVLPETLYSFRVTPNQNIREKNEFKKRYASLINTIFENRINVTHNCPLITMEAYRIGKEILLSNKKRYVNTNARYWFKLAKTSISKNNGREYTFFCLKNSLKEKDYLINHICKLPYFILDFIPKCFIKYLIKLRNYFHNHKEIA